MTGTTPPNNGAPQPAPKPLSAEVLEVANPFAEGISQIGQDIIGKNQQSKPPQK